MSYNYTKIDYDLFILETLLQDYSLEVYINEAVLMVSDHPTITQFKMVHEAFTDKVKEAFTKLLTSIASLWKKFISTMDSFLKSDKSYLEKYRDTILKKPLVEDEYVMFPYWEGYNELSNFKVPAFNYPTLKDSLNSKEEFITKYFNSYNKKDIQFNDSLRQAFRGGVTAEQKIPSSRIDLKVMYDYCIGFESLKKRLETDMREIEKAGDSAIDIIDKMKSETNANESCIYSFVKEAVIYEALPQKVSNIEKKTGSEDDSSVDGKSDSNVNKIKDSVTDKNEDINKIKTYLEVCYGALGVKMSIAQECYKAYMFIIKDHVKVNTGNSSTTTSTKTSSTKNKDTSKSNTPDLKKGWLNNIKDKITNKK